jgi:DNA-binding beta-propeller fold protein YncE
MTLSVSVSTSRASFFVAVAIIVLVGCGSVPDGVPATAGASMLFPAPPAPARFRYERSIRGSRDVTAEQDAAALKRFLNKGDTGTGPGLTSPLAIAAGQGRVFVSDPGEGRVNVFDLAGGRFYSIGQAGAGVLRLPGRLAVDRAGEVFVADGDARAVLVFDRQGAYRRSIGGRGWFDRLAAVAASPDGARLYAIEAGETPRVRVFDARSGTHLFDFGARGSGAGQLLLPEDLTVASDGRIYVLDGGNYRVQIFDRQGSYLAGFGRAGSRPGQFGRPKAIAVDGADNVYVADALFGNVQVFDASGAYQFAIAGHQDKGVPWGTLLPTGVALDPAGDLYLLDIGYRRIDVYRTLKRHGPT